MPVLSDSRELWERLSIAARTRLPAVVPQAAVPLLGAPVHYSEAVSSDLLVVPGTAHSSSAATPELWIAAAQTASTMREVQRQEFQAGLEHACRHHRLAICGVKMLVRAFW